MCKFFRLLAMWVFHSGGLLTGSMTPPHKKTRTTWPQRKCWVWQGLKEPGNRTVLCDFTIKYPNQPIDRRFHEYLPHSLSPGHIVMSWRHGDKKTYGNHADAYAYPCALCRHLRWPTKSRSRSDPSFSSDFVVTPRRVVASSPTDQCLPTP